MPQVWGPLAPELALQPGDGLRWIAESSLHFLSTVSEPKNTVVNIDRNVQLQCAAPGLYTAYLCNKAVPRWPYTDYKRWDNEMCATVNVMCQ
jgi:hypothetical protein